MSSYWGEHLHISVFGESHGEGIGAVLDNVPAGQSVDMLRVRQFMERRAPGKSPWSSPRNESDIVDVLSGIYKDKTTGTPLAVFIKNRDKRSKDYDNLLNVPRPGHADITGRARYRGANDPRGGGHFSARVTAGICFQGAICLQILERQGIHIAARIKEIAGLEDVTIDYANPPYETLKALATQTLPVVDEQVAQQMIDRVEEVRLAQDSVGGFVELFAWGMPAGIGDPMFGGLEPKLASFIYAIPAVKALSFGGGFETMRKLGSENNDSPQFQNRNGQRILENKTNNAGGIDGGISNSMPIVMQVGFKPTSSISIEQDSVNLLSEENSKLVVHGRHDPCVVPRAVPIVEAASAIVLLDALLLSGKFDYEKDHDEELLD